ncbi:MAG: ankyrin repeat domain-containing protein [Planctomycetes bacterium]|nr:ankyrin repeat domain-containing protein [Planctomycetota bacterium]
MTASTLPKYLVGSRQAILEVASSSSALLIGVLFVVSAGLAREYDGEDLIHEPWRMLRPFAASLVAGTTLFLLVHGATLLHRGRDEGTPPSVLRAYRSFMSLFWMTAPMAWLYAIPYERFMSPVDAISVNLWTLALVAGWRVLLITRVISVVYGISAVASFFLVMLFADAVVFGVVTLVPTPIIDIMGGIRHSDRDALIAGTAFSLMILSVLSAPVWIIGALISIGVIEPKWGGFAPTRASAGKRGLLMVAVVSIVVWIPMLVFTQPEQVHRRDAERQLRSDRIAEALASISLREAHDYPPHWNPPPRLGYREKRPSLDEVMAAMRSQWPREWIAELYLDKVRRQLQQDLLPFWSATTWVEIVAHLEEYRDIFESAHANADRVSFLLEFDDTLTGEDRIALERLHRLGAPVDPDLLTDAEKSGVIVRAISDSDLDTARPLIASGVDLDAPAPGWGGNTPLAQAAIVDSVEAVRLLVESGASLETPSGDYELTPALWAAYHGSNGALEELLDLGANAHAGTEAFGSLIYAAAFRENVETVRILLGRDLGIPLWLGRASDGATPLHTAYRNGNPELIQLLLDAGAEPELPTTDGRRPEQYGR